MSNNIYGIKDSANLTIKYKAGANKGKIFAYADYATVTTNEWTSEQVYARSKSVNAIRWDYNRQSTLAVDMEIFDLRWIAMLAGTELTSSTEAKPILRRKVLTLDASKKATLTETPKTGSLSVFKLEADGLTNAEELTTDKGYTITEKEITVTSGTEGDKIAVYYMLDVSNTKSFTIESDKFPSNFEVYADTMIRNTDGEDEFVQIHYLNVKPQSNFTITMDANNITTLSVTFDVLKDSASNDMAEYTIYNA
jgi:hypothetical protein